jgi:hypothetical protein
MSDAPGTAILGAVGAPAKRVASAVRDAELAKARVRRRLGEGGCPGPARLPARDVPGVVTIGNERLGKVPAEVT